MKDKAYIQWRFFHNRDEYKLLILHKNTVPCGWVCVKFSTIQELLFAQIVDYLLPNRSSTDFTHCMGAVLDYCKQMDAAEIMAAVHTQVFRQSRKAGFLPRKKEYQCIIKQTGYVLPENVRDSRLWYFTKADTDDV